MLHHPLVASFPRYPAYILVQAPQRGNKGGNARKSNRQDPDSTERQGTSKSLDRCIMSLMGLRREVYSSMFHLPSQNIEHPEVLTCTWILAASIVNMCTSTGEGEALQAPFHEGRL